MIPPTYLMSWEDIRKPGKHGLILVILALRWWGVASSASDEWKKAVDDVSSAVFCMTDGGLMAVDSTEAVRSNGQGLSKRGKGAVLTLSSSANSSKRKADVYAVSKGDSGPRKKQLLSRYVTPFWV